MMVRASAWLALACVVTLSSPALAQAQAADDANLSTVRYSYEKWSRTGAKRYVLVPRPVDVKRGNLPERTRELFKGLLADKRNSYGDARLAFKNDADATGIVFVYLDKAKAAYHPIVMAETTYTFTENGASVVKFPGVADDGWTRDDVPFAAYVIAVPLWQALPPANFAGSLVKLPDGTLLPAEAAVERLKKGDKDALAAMWSYVDSGPPPATLAAIGAARGLNLKGLDKKLLPLLESANAEVRAAAIGGLEGEDNRTVNAALRKVMDSDRDPRLRDKAAAILSQSKDPNFAAAAQFHALRSQDPTVVSAAAMSLGKSRSREATQQLLDALGHDSDGVRQAVINSLLERKAYKEMVARLSDAKAAPSVRLEVARALAGSGDKGSFQAALLHLVEHGKGNDSAGAAAKLAEFNDADTFAALGRALKHPEGATRRSAAAALSRMGDTRALELLAAANVQDPESGAAVETAIRSLYASQSLDFVLKSSKDKNPILRRAAVATLGVMVKSKEGKRYRKTIVETLQQLRGDRDPMIRAAVAASFEVMAGKDVRADVQALASDPAVEVKRAVAHALRAYPGPDTTTHLLRFAQDPDPWVVAYSCETLGLLKEQQGLNYIRTHLSHSEVMVRRAATSALVSIGATLEQRAPLLSLFSELLFDKDDEVKLKAIEGLRLVKDGRTVTLMAALIQDPSLKIRKATLKAMAETGEPSAVEAIATALEDSDLTIRKAAIDALVSLKRKEGAPVLQEYAAKESDKSLADAARQAAKTLQGG